MANIYLTKDEMECYITLIDHMPTNISTNDNLWNIYHKILDKEENLYKQKKQKEAKIKLDELQKQMDEIKKDLQTSTTSKKFKSKLNDSCGSKKVVIMMNGLCKQEFICLNIVKKNQKEFE
jgi:predicted HAD superfamily phosphohydrolase